MLIRDRARVAGHLWSSKFSLGCGVMRGQPEKPATAFRREEAGRAVAAVAPHAEVPSRKDFHGRQRSADRRPHTVTDHSDLMISRESIFADRCIAAWVLCDKLSYST